MTWHGLITARGGFPWATLEDAVARSLRERGYHTWMPRERRPTPTRPDLTVPIVRGIVFVRAPVHDWPALRRIKGYLRPLLGPGNLPAVITQQQIDVMRSVAEPLLRRHEPGRLARGDRVRLRLGAMAEIEAVIRDIRKGRATVAYELLGKGFETARSISELEPIR